MHVATHRLQSNVRACRQRTHGREVEGLSCVPAGAFPCQPPQGVAPRLVVGAARTSSMRFLSRHSRMRASSPAVVSARGFSLW